MIWLGVLVACSQVADTAGGEGAAPDLGALASASTWDGHFSWDKWNATGELTCGAVWHAAGPSTWDEVAEEATAELTLTFESAPFDVAPCMEVASTVVSVGTGASGALEARFTLRDATGATVGSALTDAAVDAAASELTWSTPDDIDAYSNRDVYSGGVWLL